MAADLRGSCARQHLLHSRSARLRLPHHGVQLASGQDPGCQAHSARYVDVPDGSAAVVVVVGIDRVCLLNCEAPPHLETVDMHVKMALGRHITPS